MRVIRFIIVCTILGTTPFAFFENGVFVPFVLYQAGYSKDGAIREGDWVLTVNRHNKAEELYNLGNNLSQEDNLIDRPEYGQLIDRLHATFIEHNDHDSDTREPRTTKAFRITR